MSASQGDRRVSGIVGLFPELIGFGGVQESGRHTAAALVEYARRHECSVRLLSLNDPGGDQFLRFDKSDFSFGGFHRSKVTFVLSALRATKELDSKRWRLVVAGHPNLAPVAQAIKILFQNTKSIVICHGIEVWTRLSMARRFALLNADRALAPSRSTIEKLVRVQSVPKPKTRLLPWPLSQDFLEIADAGAPPPSPPNLPDGRILLTVGRWVTSERYKGADELFRAVRELCSKIPELRLVVVGGGDDLPRLRTVAADLGVADRIHFLENLPPESLAACYARADVFALPSTGEGFGLVFLEAMAFSKPVIAAASAGAVDVVEDGVNGLLIPPGNLEALVSSLDRLFSNQSLRMQLGRQGAEIVRKRYTFSTFLFEIEKVIDECISQSVRPCLPREGM
jgi:phosphatidyl-myo-inositol dimannoside synthase